MPLQPANLLATGYIVPNRFVMMDPQNLANQLAGNTRPWAAWAASTASRPLPQSRSLTGTLAAGYAGTTIGISADGTNYPSDQ